MKKILLIFIFCCIPHAFAEKIERICQHDLVTRMPDNWPPFSYVNDGVLTGYHVDFVKAIFKGIGCNVKFITDATWSRSLLLLRDGNIDFLMNATKTKSREESFIFSIGYEKEHVAIYTKSRKLCNSAHQTIHDFLARRMVLGMIRGAAYGEYINKIMQEKDINRNVVEVKDDLSLQRLSASGRVDAFVGYFPNGLISNAAITINDKRAYMCTKPIGIGENHFIVSKRNIRGHALVDKINNEIIKINKDGTLDHLRYPHKSGK
jgi:ABC-type amino acid transport substrate-binding protein